MELNTNCGNSGLRQECVASEKNTEVSLVVVQFDIKGKGIFKFCSESGLWAFKSVLKNLRFSAIKDRGNTFKFLFKCPNLID